MANLEDAMSLRLAWTEDFETRYAGYWIAFSRGVVRDQSTDLASLLVRFADEIRRESGPLFAFVQAGIRQ